MASGGLSVLFVGLAGVVLNGLTGGGPGEEAVLWVRGSVAMAETSLLVRFCSRRVQTATGSKKRGLDAHVTSNTFDKSLLTKESRVSVLLCLFERDSCLHVLIITLYGRFPWSSSVSFPSDVSSGHQGFNSFSAKNEF